MTSSHWIQFITWRAVGLGLCDCDIKKANGIGRKWNSAQHDIRCLSSRDWAVSCPSFHSENSIILWFFCCCFYPIYLYVCVLYPTFFFNSSSFCWSYGSLYYWSSTKKKREKTNKLWNQWSNCSFINAKLLTQFYISFLQIYVDSHILPNSSHSHYVALTGKWIEKSIW